MKREKTFSCILKSDDPSGVCYLMCKLPAGLGLDLVKQSLHGNSFSVCFLVDCKWLKGREILAKNK